MKKLKILKKILLLSLIVVVVLSGCIGQPDGIKDEYKDDIFTVEEYYVDNINPTENSLATISFLVQNNGDRREGVDVDVSFNVDPFEVDKLFCHGVETEPEDGIYACKFKGIESLDVRQVSITLRAPEVESTASFPISYTINYAYSGYRKADIPLIDQVTRTRPVGKFGQSTPSYGPVEMNFEPPIGSSHIEDDKVVKEYWGVLGRPFEVKMEFKHVGSSSIGVVSPTIIEERDVKLTPSNNIQKADGYTCHFEESGDYLVSTKNITLPKGRTELVCNFEMTRGITQPEVTATIMAEFYYEYEYMRTETLKVINLEEEG